MPTLFHLLNLSSDGVLTHEIAHSLKSGHIHGIDSSASMIQTAKSTSPSNATFSVLDVTALTKSPDLQSGEYDKVFSNAALHWILRNADHRRDVLVGAYNALKPSGTFVFEMGGHGNVPEMHAALIMATARRIGITKAREVDPWFFPDEKWMKKELEGVGFKIEKSESQYRATPATTGENGGVAGWVRLMGKQFFDAVAEEGSKERVECVNEVIEALETVCDAEGGGTFIGYVRLRMVARKV